MKTVKILQPNNHMARMNLLHEIKKRIEEKSINRIYNNYFYSFYWSIDFHKRIKDQLKHEINSRND